MTIKQILNETSKKIEYIDAKTLIKYVLNKDNNYLIINDSKELEKDEENKIKELVDKVKAGYPLQYITNKQEFMKLDFYVDENVLIPQPDTEILVQNAIEYCKQKENCKVLDLCTGSGAIAVSIKNYVPNAVVIGADISKEALKIAKLNSEKNNTCVEFVYSDMFENICGEFDLIVSNPPYIKTDVIIGLPTDVKHEPKIALDGGKEGLKFYKIIRENAEKYLKQNGAVMLEIGYDQKEEVSSIFEGSTCIKDYGNKDRVIIWNLSQQR